MKNNSTNKIIDVVSILLAISFFYFILVFGDLPAEIPLLFNGKDEVDGWGSKWSLIGLPLIGIALWAGFVYLQRNPHLLNYPVEITDQNKERQYQLGTQFLGIVKLLSLMLLAYVNVKLIHLALERSSGPSLLVVISLIGLILLSVIFYLIQSSKQP